MPIDWDSKFKTEYDAVKATLASTGEFAADWRDLVRSLHQLMGSGGFDPGKENTLGQLRLRVERGVSQTKITEDQGILQAVGAWVEGSGGTLTAAAKKRAAALKFLRHVYLQNKAGNRKLWVLSLPTAITHWPTRHVDASCATVGAVKTMLAASAEHFSEQQKRYLGNVAQESLAWCQKTGIVLAKAKAAASLGKPNPTRDSAIAIVKRWFADPGLDDAALATHIGTLDTGFKKIIAMLNKGNFIVTDWVPFRGTNDVDEAGFLASEAFTFANNNEGMDVVYIESNFFVDNAGNIIAGQGNWTRIMVHELTHLVCGTDDVKNGQTRYAWYGIGPHAGYPGSQCVRNADNWAFFAADCAGALTDGQRAAALKIV
jgi:hypothetical protein